MSHTRKHTKFKTLGTATSPSWRRFSVAALVAALPAVSSLAQTAGGTVSSVQGTARPFGLDIAGPVMQAGSDARAQDFQRVLPGMLNFLRTSLPEAHNNLHSPLAFSLDPSRLTLSSMADVRAYFAYEGAGYHNTIGFNTTGVGVASGDPRIIFPDASSSLGYGGSGTGVRSASDPLLAGDFVDLGSFAAGTPLDFFLIANGASGGRSVFSTSGTRNPDGLNHVATFTPSFWAVANSPYLFIAFEDLLGGGDQDFNDVIIALDIGSHNMARLLATPEPATWLTLGALVPLAVWTARRHRHRPPASQPVAA